MQGRIASGQDTNSSLGALRIGVRDWYCKTLNVSVPSISRTSRAKQNREIKGCEYQLRAKIGQNYYSITNYTLLIRQNKRGQNNFVYTFANF